MASKAYDDIVKTLSDSCEKIAEKSMNDAATEIHDLSKSSDSAVDTSISLDGSWQKREYSSLNGYVAALSMESGKVLDIEVMSRFCRLCDANKNLEKNDPIALENFKANHNSCSANYKGSAPNMEVTGAKRIFSRSIDNQKLRYVEMYSDGDSKAYPAIKDTYVNSNDSDIEVQKKECVGHVQKRVGTRLRELKKEVKGLKGKLTEKVIDRLQNFYELQYALTQETLKECRTIE